MPIKEFQCEDGHRVGIVHKKGSAIDEAIEILCPALDNDTIGLDEYEDKWETWFGKCGKIAEKVWSRPGTVKVGKPTVVFVNPANGRAVVATSYQDKAPPGFVKHELRGLDEREKFEKQQNAINSRDDDVYNELQYEGRNQVRKQIIDDAQAKVSIDATVSDNPLHTELLMKAAIERIRKKPVVRKERKTKFLFDINHKDASNMKK